MSPDSGHTRSKSLPLIDTEKLIEIRDRLYLREQALVRIWESEQEIHRIAHGQFPIMGPEWKRRSAKKSAEGCNAKEDFPPKIRRLDAEEDAYRVSIECEGERIHSLVDSPDAVRQFFMLPNSSCRVVDVDTITFDEDGREHTVGTLYREAAPRV